MSFFFEDCQNRSKVKKKCSYKFRKINRKTPVPGLFFYKVAGLRLDSGLTQTLAQVFSCEFCGISKNTFFTEHLRETASAKKNVTFLTC